jgi:hypothetical protein
MWPFPPNRRAIDTPHVQHRLRALLYHAPILVRCLGFLASLALAGIAIVWGSQQQPDTIPDVVFFANLPRSHTTQPVIYPRIPPVGGAHRPVWQNCGRYDEPIENEYAVHSLEHGAVWITYRPDLPADALAQLRDLLNGQVYTLLSPYPNLPAPVVASAWGAQLQMNSAADPRLPWFITQYRQGSQTPEPGATCSDGVGIPMARS